MLNEFFICIEYTKHDLNTSMFNIHFILLELQNYILIAFGKLDI